MNQYINPTTDEPYNVVDIIICFESVLIGLFSLIGALGFLPAIFGAFASGSQIFELIEREPKIQSLQKDEFGFSSFETIDLGSGIQF